MPAPYLALHIMLKEHSRNPDFFRKIDGSVQEIANRNVKILFLQLRFNCLPHGQAFETGNRVSRLSRQAVNIVQSSQQRVERLPGGNANCRSETAAQLLLIGDVARAIIIREESHLVPRVQLSSNLERANVSSAIDRQQLVGLDPEDSHRCSRRRIAGARLAAASVHLRTILPSAS